MKRRRPRRVPADGRGGGASDAGFTINSKTADPAAFEVAKKRQASRRARFDSLLGAILGACDGSDNAESKPKYIKPKESPEA